jgi:hypothetical protein
MKKLFTLIVIICLIGIVSLSGQKTIAQWNFNSESDTIVPGGATTPTPAIGTGTASLIGGVTASFASGRASGGSSDTVSTAPPNYAWNTTTYAAAGTENKLRGIEFKVSTIGYKGVSFSFDQRLSNTANNTYLLQYTVNGSDWIDADTFTFTPADTTGDRWYNKRTADLTSVTELNNNANASFRIVSAFDPVKGNYTSAKSGKTYATTGTSRYDMVTVTGTSLSEVPFSVFDKGFIMFPNPANSILHFSKTINVSIFDLFGNKVMSASKVNSADISALKKGVYLVKADTGWTQKLIKE